MSTEQALIKKQSERRSFINKVAAASLTVGAGALLTGLGSRRASAQQVQSGGATVSAAEIALGFHEIMNDEANHVAFLTSALGSAARPAPSFFEPTVIQPAPNITTFVQYAAALENTGTGAYLAATPLPNVIANPQGLLAAAQIALVEGRHAGFLNAILGRPLLTDPNQNDSVEPTNYIEQAQGPDQVYTRAAPFTGTVVNLAPGAVSTGTNLNNGTPLPSSADIATVPYTDVLNYALFLEYLEATFYATNVPHFFPH